MVKYYRPPFLYDLMFWLFVSGMKLLSLYSIELPFIEFLVEPWFILIYLLFYGLLSHIIFKGIYWCGARLYWSGMQMAYS